jgi:hypothetical protein
MAHDVFISHSSKDKAMADAICAGLEARGIRCWIAPRDIAPGQNYAGQLYKAIEACKVFLVVLTGNSLLSTHILKEVELAVQSGNAILPFRLQDIPLTDDLKYYLGNVHWLDALTPPLEKHIGILADYIQRILNAQLIKAAGPIDENPLQEKIAKPVPIPFTQTQNASKKSTASLLLPIGLILLAIAVVIGAVIIGKIFLPKSDKTSQNDQKTDTIEFFPTVTSTQTTSVPSAIVQNTMTATPIVVTGILINNANCYETSRETSPLVETLLAGTIAIILGQNNTGDWVNLKYDGDKHFYHDENTRVQDCWMYKLNLEIQAVSTPLAVFTPKPATRQIWKAVVSGSRPDGSTFGTDFENAEKSTAISQAEEFCKNEIGFGNTCTYTMTTTYVW